MKFISLLALSCILIVLFSELVSSRLLKHKKPKPQNSVSCVTIYNACRVSDDCCGHMRCEINAGSWVCKN